MCANRFRCGQGPRCSYCYSGQISSSPPKSLKSFVWHISTVIGLTGWYCINPISRKTGGTSTKSCPMGGARGAHWLWWTILRNGRVAERRIFLGSIILRPQVRAYHALALKHALSRGSQNQRGEVGEVDRSWNHGNCSVSQSHNTHLCVIILIQRQHVCIYWVREKERDEEW